MPDSDHLVRIPGARHAHMRVQPTSRRLAIRRADGRLDDLGSVSVDLLMPMTGGLDERGEPYPLVNQDERVWAIAYREGGRREIVALIPPDARRNAAGRVIVMDGVEDEDGRIETWYFDAAAEAEIARENEPGAEFRASVAP